MIPWGKLLRSVPVWASAVATMGNQWGDATLALGMTKYLKLIYGFSTANVNIFQRYIPKQIKTHSILRFILQNKCLSFNDFKDSVLTTLPHIGHFMAALTCGLLVDHVRESKIVSTTTARKLVVYTGTYSLINQFINHHDYLFLISYLFLNFIELDFYQKLN